MRFISKNNYDILDDVFEVDDEIASTISILNKKGYYTEFSCSGHKEPSIDSYVKFPKNQFKLLDRMITSDYYIVGEQEDKYVIALGFNKTYIYISFKEDYNFESIPAGFEYSNDLDYDENSKSWIRKSCVFKEVDLFNEDGNMKLDIIIEDELNKSLIELYNWALSLEKIKQLRK